MPDEPSNDDQPATVAKPIVVSFASDRLACQKRYEHHCIVMAVLRDLEEWRAFSRPSTVGAKRIDRMIESLKQVEQAIADHDWIAPDSSTMRELKEGERIRNG